jgi:DNA repair protein RadC
MTERPVVIRDLPMEERPRERLQQYGAETLSNAELLAILLRVGSRGESAVRMAERLLRDLGGLTGIAKARLPQLCSQSGLGLAKGAQLLAAFELGKRLAATSEQGRPVVANAADAAALVMEELRYLDQECLVALFLDVRQQLIRKKTIMMGTATGSPAHPREIFKEAVAHSAVKLIIVHNHPSGDPSPSSDDLLLTQRLVEAGKLMGIELLDHLIIGAGKYLSLRELGKM